MMPRVNGISRVAVMMMLMLRIVWSVFDHFPTPLLLSLVRANHTAKPAARNVKQQNGCHQRQAGTTASHHMPAAR